MRVALVVLLVASTADAKRRPPKKPAPTKVSPASVPTLPAPAELSREDGEIVLKFFNHFIDMVKSAKGDCGQVASAMNLVIDRNRELIRKISEAQDKGIQFPKFVNDALTKRANELIPLFARCADHPDVIAATERMSNRKTTDTQSQ